MAFDFDVTVRPIRNPEGNTLAFAQLSIDGEIWIDGFRIVKGQYGLFVGAPNHKGKNKEGKDDWFDDVRFIGNKEEGEKKTALQEQIYNLMIERYEQAQAQSNRGNAAAAHASQSSMNNDKRLWP